MQRRFSQCIPCLDKFFLSFKSCLKSPDRKLPIFLKYWPVQQLAHTRYILFQKILSWGNWPQHRVWPWAVCLVCGRDDTWWITEMITWTTPTRHGTNQLQKHFQHQSVVKILLLYFFSSRILPTLNEFTLAIKYWMHFVSINILFNLDLIWSNTFTFIAKVRPVLIDSILISKHNLIFNCNKSASQNQNNHIIECSWKTDNRLNGLEIENKSG